MRPHPATSAYSEAEPIARHGRQNFGKQEIQDGEKRR